METVIKYLPWTAGRLYVDYKFIEQVENEAEHILTDIFNVMGSTLKSLAWLDASSIKNALVKLDEMVKNIGYPNWIKNSSALDNFHADLTINPGDTWFQMCQNVLPYYLEY